jgi:hypothetical protein
MDAANVEGTFFFLQRATGGSHISGHICQLLYITVSLILKTGTEDISTDFS